MLELCLMCVVSINEEGHPPLSLEVGSSPLCLRQQRCICDAAKLVVRAQRVGGGGEGGSLLRSVALGEDADHCDVDSFDYLSPGG